MVDAALRDYRDAPLAEPLRATLAFLEKLTLEPTEVGEADVDAAIEAGVTPQALRDAIEVCAGFNVIDRIADALDFEQQTPEGLAAGARQLTTRGYA
jgi:alkylhydroperoxidase family enzyme